DLLQYFFQRPKIGECARTGAVRQGAAATGCSEGRRGTARLGRTTGDTMPAFPAISPRMRTRSAHGAGRCHQSLSPKVEGPLFQVNRKWVAAEIALDCDRL